MRNISRIVLLLSLVAIPGCGQKDERKEAEEKSRVEQAVKEAVTKEFRRTLLSWKQVRCRRIYSKKSAPAGTQSSTAAGWGKHSLEIQSCPVFYRPAKERTRTTRKPMGFNEAVEKVPAN